jgi:hypothetical protein
LVVSAEMVVVRLETGVLEVPVALQATSKSRLRMEGQYLSILQLAKTSPAFNLRLLLGMVVMAVVLV